MSTMKVKIVHDERSTLMKRQINCAIIDDRDGSSGAMAKLFSLRNHRVIAIKL